MTVRQKTINLTLRKFTFSYLLLLLVLLVMGVSIFLISINVMSKQIVDTRLLLLEQTAIRLDNTLSEADNFTYTLSYQTPIRKLMLSKDVHNAQTLVDIQTAVTEVPNFPDNSGLIDWYMIYFTSGDFLIEPNNSFLDSTTWYGISYAYDNLSEQQWQNQVLRSDARSLTLPAAEAFNSKRRGRMLIYTKPLNYSTRQMGKAIYYLNENKLHELFSPVKDYSGFFAVLNCDGTLLAASESMPADVGIPVMMQKMNAPSGYFFSTVNGKNMMVTYRTLGTHGWSVISATPYSAVLSLTYQVLKSLLFGLFAAVLIGVTLSFWSMHSNRKPLAHTIETLSQYHKNNNGRNGLWQLDYAVKQLISSRESLSACLEEQSVELRAVIASRLESGDLLDEREISMLLNLVGIIPKGSRFRGVYMTVNGCAAQDANLMTRCDLPHTLILEALAPFSNRISFLSMKEQNCFILLYAENENEWTDLHACFRALYTVIHNIQDLEPVFFVGTEHTQLRYLPHSLSAARKYLLQGNSVGFLVVATEGESDVNGYAYTDQDEKKLLSFASLGKEESCLALLQEIHQRNICEPPLSRPNQQLLFFRMVGTLYQLGDSVELSDDLIFSLHRIEMDGFFALMREQYARACRRSKEKQTQYTARLVAEMLAYIDEKYSDYNLSLASMAMHFGVTEKYLSSFIRDKAGINFSSYVEKLRIAKASEYLSNSRLTMEEIARRIGYSNGKTFCRAYSRATGVTPTYYRKHQTKA